MKIYLDNNLGVSNVEQEELTQDTIGYNILKVYIPNAVLTPYDTFTCYYGALLQNGRKVGWFAMEARTSTDADYEANYTLYKATLEQCVVSVEGKVYIGCQVLLGNSGNATLIKKNTAVVQFNVRKSVAINNDILVLDTDQTTTDVLESYKNLLENALLTYATKAEVYTKAQVDALLLQKSDKATTYTKTEVDSALSLKADKSNTYTKQEVNEVALGIISDIDEVRANVVTIDNRTTVLETDVTTLQNNTYSKTEVDGKLDLKADKTTVEGINTRVGSLETDIADLESVQNVVDVVATKSALNSYDTTKLDVNDKVQVIADETHDGASTIYNWSGSAWQYVGAFGGNSYTKAETYNKTQIDSALSDKADKSNTYTRAVIDSMILTLSTDKADKTEIDGKLEEVGQMFEIVGNEVQKKVNAEYICKGTNITQTSYSNTNPSKSTKVVLSKLGGMSYKVNDTIQHSAVTQIRSKNGSTIVNSLSIPSYIRNIEGYGWGIDNTCYNYIDFANKKFVQKVGRVDLGTLTWNYNALGEPSYFYASIANAVNSINVSCSLYESAVVLPTNTEDKIICITQNQVRIRDNELEGSIVDLNTKLNGVYLYYERGTSIETDISSYISKDTLEVVDGGTLEFLNTYNQAVPNEIAYLFNAVTLNNIVDSNGNPNVIATKQELNEKSTVTANPTLAGTEADLTGLEVDGTKYKVSSGGGETPHLYEYFITIVINYDSLDAMILSTNLYEEFEHGELSTFTFDDLLNEICNGYILGNFGSVYGLNLENKTFSLSGGGTYTSDDITFDELHRKQIF